ncbi:peptidase, S9A/B/C family, catalytic domain protein [Aeromicrobium marinum DSM 15272]|uniref:Peptidase, S9A/B/C family, catalytic domain protein n=1 Tax=Aeromicrobium marinum DSM 15272 TaxID=585531 RepID=E2SE51_9ACTN|nr:prolyl oligopeptidase family serine peptidase [Aeromicrobium marinum]EFQ82778.1 peptidase, S9A/B/C family, catalytic domain protein [Aeromicrobium marinum DSM 15272]
MTLSYPRLAARTLRFTLGVPRSITVAPDGRTVRFVRTSDGVTRTGILREIDVATGEEAVLADPSVLLGESGEQLSAAERVRRERSRESAAGIVGYDVDPAGRWACFALSGGLWVVDLRTRASRRLPTPDGVVDPRLDPTGRRIAYAAGRSLRVIAVDGTGDQALAEPEGATETWGQAEFIAAEEMDRMRGFWWAPDGESLLVERFDEAPVQEWHIADPEHPERRPATVRYPAAGTPNAAVSLWHVSLDGDRRQVQWDHVAFEYLARVSWTEHGDPVVQVLSRDQRRSQVLAIDPADDSTRVLRDLSDDHWVELTAAPRFAPGGRLVSLEDVDGWRRVVVDGVAVSPTGWQVRSVVAVLDDAVVATASHEPTEIQVVRFGFDGTLEELTVGAAVHGAVVGGGTTVVVRSALDHPSTTVTAHPAAGDAVRIGSVAEPVPFEPHVHLLAAGDRELRTAVVFPRDHTPGTPLPVLMDPYGGPHAQRVLASARMFTEAQWLADQGFCVVVADGRGTPGRGHAWEREIAGAFADVTLDDQVDALHAVAAAFPGDVDTSRVGIMGWSYGGYLAALAVLKRPDVFHVAVAGAPVTEWRLYDTCYTERYLGDPTARPDVYDANSLLPLAADLSRPLLLIHGLADDNVVAAHTLRLSSALMAAGRSHTVLPLAGVTHMTPQETVAENLKLLQVRFLHENLPRVEVSPQDA